MARELLRTQIQARIKLQRLGVDARGQRPALTLEGILNPKVEVDQVGGGRNHREQQESADESPQEVAARWLLSAPATFLSSHSSPIRSPIACR